MNSLSRKYSGRAWKSTSWCFTTLHSLRALVELSSCDLATNASGPLLLLTLSGLGCVLPRGDWNRIAEFRLPVDAYLLPGGDLNGDCTLSDGPAPLPFVPLPDPNNSCPISLSDLLQFHWHATTLSFHFFNQSNKPLHSPLGLDQTL